MENVKSASLSNDIYDFLGCCIGIRSSSVEVLSHLRSMYARFFKGTKEGFWKNKNDGECIPSVLVEIIDKWNEAGVLSIKDSNHYYRISENNGKSFFTRVNLQDYSEDLAGYCDPVSLLQAVPVETLARAKKDSFFIHAGVLSWKEQGILLVGNSKSGKTTLTVNLILHGFKFLSDEIACLSQDLSSLEPFPRKINLRRDCTGILGLSLDPGSVVNFMPTGEPVHMIDAEEIVPSCLSEPCKPRYLFFLQGFPA